MCVRIDGFAYVTGMHAVVLRRRPRNLSAGDSFFYNRLIRLATYPAPKPLSIFTTVTLLAQLLSKIGRAHV